MFLWNFRIWTLGQENSLRTKEQLERGRILNSYVMEIKKETFKNAKCEAKCPHYKILHC